MASESARQCRGAFLISLLIGNEFVMVANARRVSVSLDDLENEASDLDDEHNATAMKITGTALVKVNRTLKSGPGGMLCCCKDWSQADEEKRQSGKSCSFKGMGFVKFEDGQNRCCKERPNHCDEGVGSFFMRRTMAYYHATSPMAGCGAPLIEGHAPLMRTKGSRNLMVRAEIVKMTQVTGTWEGGWMLYFGLTNTARSGMANAAVEMEAGCAEVLTETVGAGFAPVAITFGVIGLATAQYQVHKLSHLLNQDLAEPQRRYIQCQITNQKKNQFVTTMLLGIGVAAAAGAFAAGITVVVAGAVAATIAIGNTIRNKFYSCKSESRELTQWLEDQQEMVYERMAEVDGKIVDDMDEDDVSFKVVGNDTCDSIAEGPQDYVERICVDLDA